MPKDKAPHVVAVVGSPRRRGNTSLLTDAVLGELERLGVTCTKLLLGELSVAPCLGHEACAEFEACTIRDDASEVLEQVYAADGLLLATPVYYEDVTAQMKAFIDRNYFQYNREQMLRPRVVGLLVVTAETGLDETVAVLRRFVALAGGGGVPTLAVTGFADALGAAAGDEALLGKARGLGADMARVLQGEPHI